jgi:hypothetical protein
LAQIESKNTPATESPATKNYHPPVEQLAQVAMESERQVSWYSLKQSRQGSKRGHKPHGGLSI